MLCDAHVHIGQFFDIYTSPFEMVEKKKKKNVNAIAVSTTTTCEDNFTKVVEEMQQFCKLFGKLAIPVLWVTPLLLNNSNLLESVLGTVDWRCIKVHPQLCPDKWNPDGVNFNKSVELSNQLNVPLLIHTGVVKNCHPLQLQPLFKKHSNTTFILAHGRPIDETVTVMLNYPNTLVDTAFMFTHDVVKLLNLGLSDRILWGSDYPIIKYYDRDINGCDYYNNTLCELKNCINENDYLKITQNNFLRLFNIQI